MSHVPTNSQTDQVKGALFEGIVRNLLLKSNFSPLKPDGNSVRRSFFNIRGRGCFHNIDACGKYDVPIPYVYPIRLLAEAKCYNNNVGLDVLQSFVGVVKDISENYFVPEGLTSEQRLKFKRYTDCGAVFSSSGFTPKAQDFALAHGINLVAYGNNPIIRRAVNIMVRLIQTLRIPYCAENKKAFSKYVDDRLKNPPKRIPRNRYVNQQSRDLFVKEFNGLSNTINSVKASLIGVAVSSERDFHYPIHLLSQQTFPTWNFAETDYQYFIPQYEPIENGLVFRIDIPNNEAIDGQSHLYFSLPNNVYQNYFALGRMPQFKIAFMNEIEIPLTINNMRRVVCLKINEEWKRRHVQ